ncbi:MAG: hypothetical protein HYS57_01660 [Parcubacteria group bacterium]|nr:hypothetical protein [Parcubacteria group bacterium]
MGGKNYRDFGTLAVVTVMVGKILGAIFDPILGIIIALVGGVVLVALLMTEDGVTDGMFTRARRVASWLIAGGLIFAVTTKLSHTSFWTLLFIVSIAVALYGFWRVNRERVQVEPDER